MPWLVGLCYDPPMPAPRPRRRGLTLVDVVVLLAVVASLATIVIAASPHLGHGSGGSSKMKCGSNLRQIGQSMRMYAIDDARVGAYSRTRFDPSDPTPRFFTNPMATDPFADDGPQPNDVTAPFWHLLRYSDLVPEIFICPSDVGGQPVDFAALGVADKFQMSNFPGRANLSYSFANPYPSPEATADGWEWNDALPSTMPLAADVNPGLPQLSAVTTQTSNYDMRFGNSPNHNREGQSILYADGSVRFEMTPFAGAMKDNIYTAGGVRTAKPGPPEPVTVAVVSPPLTGNDMVLLPTAADFPRPGENLLSNLPGQRPPRVLLWSVAASAVIGLILIVGVVLWANRARRRKLERGDLPEMSSE